MKLNMYALFVRIAVDGEQREWRHEGDFGCGMLAKDCAKNAVKAEGSGNVRLFDVDAGMNISLST